MKLYDQKWQEIIEALPQEIIDLIPKKDSDRIIKALEMAFKAGNDFGLRTAAECSKITLSAKFSKTREMIDLEKSIRGRILDQLSTFCILLLNHDHPSSNCPTRLKKR